MEIVRHRAYARAGLIGNPSDGYGGKTISFTLRNFFAEVVLYTWDELEILWSEQDRSRFESLDELVEDVILNGYYGGVRLIKATIKRFADYCRERSLPLARGPFSVRYHTNIPRGVGLSGSSAIVVASLRCLMQYYAAEIPLRVQPSLVRSVENDELGIACGYQDRVVQAYEGLVYMDFGVMEQVQGFECGRYARLDASRLPPLYLVFDRTTSKTSQSVHGPLRTRVRESRQLADTIAEIAALVPAARHAIEQGDAPRLHELLNRNFDLRRALYSIRPAHLEMIETARSVGASAKFAGSGGSIVGTYQGADMLDRLRQAMAAKNPNWHVMTPDLTGPGVDSTSPRSPSPVVRQ